MLDEDMDVQAQDLAIEEIRELLLEAGADITLAQTEQLAAFIAEAGGIDEAAALLGELERGRDAA
jgi:hypothetical protein